MAPEGKPQVEDLAGAASAAEAADRARMLHELQMQQAEVASDLGRVGFDGESESLLAATRRVINARRDSQQIEEVFGTLVGGMRQFEQDLDVYWRRISIVRVRTRANADEIRATQDLLRRAVSREDAGGQMILTLDDGSKVGTRSLDDLFNEKNDLDQERKRVIEDFNVGQHKLMGILIAVGEGVPGEPDPSDLSEVKIKIDTSNLPEGVDVAEIEEMVRRGYRKSAYHLHPSGPLDEVEVQVRFDDLDGAAAYVNGTEMVIDLDAVNGENGLQGLESIVFHESVHVAQRDYQDTPTWVVEGLADYVTYYKSGLHDDAVKVSPIPLPGSHDIGDSWMEGPHAPRWTDGYQQTAGFFNWLQETRDPQIISRIDEAARSGNYSDSVILGGSGAATMDDLWAEYVEASRQDLITSGAQY